MAEKTSPEPAKAGHETADQRADALAAQGAREAATVQYEGQRAINLLWETTQKQVALSVIWGSVGVAIILSVFGRWLKIPNDIQLAAVVFLFGVANLVTGFYFGRTNHARVGGVKRGDQGR